MSAKETLRTYILTEIETDNPSLNAGLSVVKSVMPNATVDTAGFFRDTAAYSLRTAGVSPGAAVDALDELAAEQYSSNPEKQQAWVNVVAAYRDRMKSQMFPTIPPNIAGYITGGSW